jgi:hypothetical protein
MPTNEEMARHLLACYDTIYMALGESAPTLSTDAYVVRTYEMGRAFGALALEMRDYTELTNVAPIGVLDAVLRHAVANDDSGAMVLYAMAMVVGPRLLVTLLDARANMTSDATLLALFNHGSQVVVAEVLATGDVAKSQAPIDDPSWQAAAFDLATTLDMAGNAESLGLSR